MSDTGDGYNRLSAEEMDEKRKEQVAYEYLCRLEEAKTWIEACIGEHISPTIELEESLQNGVVLAKLGHFISPELVPLKKIYDPDLIRYGARGLHFRHTDNINHWLKSLKDVGLPENFYPETTDIYDRKNIPRLIYCLHALSLYLFKIGKAPQIQDLYGKIKFTDEEISNMKKELDKYGITMPAFSKIGGMLANEMPVDEAALHAAIIAINSAIDKGEPGPTLDALMNPAAYLNNLDKELAEEYQNTLLNAKTVKAENCKTKSFNMDSLPDIYDELLTQAEIQGHVNGINIICCLAMVDETLTTGDISALVMLLRRKEMGFKNVKDDVGFFYLDELRMAREKKKNIAGSEKLSKEEIQTGVNAANEKANNLAKLHQAMVALNTALEGDNPDATIEQLLNPVLNLASVNPPSRCLYHEELQALKEGGNLEYVDVCKAMKILNAVSRVDNAVDAGNSSCLLETLLDNDAHIDEVYPHSADKYLDHLIKLKEAKSNCFCQMLTHHDVQSSVNRVNSELELEQERIEAVAKINEIIDQDDPKVLFPFFSRAGVGNASDELAVHYHQLLRQAKKSKAKTSGDHSSILWFEEIQDTINEANQDSEESRELSACVAAVNISVEDEEVQNLTSCLRHPILRLKSVNTKFGETYLSTLKECRLQKCLQGECGSGWMMNRLKNGSKFFFNVETMEGSWTKDDQIEKDFSLLTRDDIERCVTDVNKTSARHALFLAHEEFITKFQALAKGMLGRKLFQRRKETLLSMTPAAETIQKWWKMIMNKRMVEKRMRVYLDNQHSVVKAQAFIKGYLARKVYLERVNFFKENEAAIVKIQAFMRSAHAKQDYNALMHGENVPISVIRKFVYILEITDQDYAEEIELDKLKQQVVQDIRSNQTLDHDLIQMDIKIGLLVKNRISLQDVISQNKFLRQHHSSSSISSTSTMGPGGNVPPGGIRGLSRASHDKLQAYQHLFYLLQTQPNYLAKLMFELPQSKTTKFMESAVLSLFNYASNQRDEYMLIGLFKTALEEEIKSKVTAPSDIITGNPMVVKMIVSFNRNSRGQSLLRELLNPLVKSVIEDKKLHINTNVVEVYKQWINQLEAETGKPSLLPYEVSMEQALSHKEVDKILRDTVSVLQEWTEKFLNAILSSIDKIPYGMRYMARVMRNALQDRFPSCQEKEILKIIGNLIYYRYINSAIVAPDAFDIIEVAASNGLTNEQRRNLGSIAKILQFAASNKGFSSDSPHLVSLNSYIVEAHSRFKKYFADICEVEEPESVFNVDQYSDVARITKPIIYISVGEIIDMHKLLLNHQNVIAPDPCDPLHELLDDLGDVCDVGALLGDSSEDDVSRAQMMKNEISLTLLNKFEIPDNDHVNTQSLLLRTKQMIIDILRCQKSGDSLMDILKSQSTEDEEGVHKALMKERERLDTRTTKSSLARQPSVSTPAKLSLNNMKKIVISNLVALEQAGLISKSDGYESLVAAIVRDIRNQRLHRQRRKVEMTKLKTTLKSLSQKRTFFEEQINYYNQYVKTCLDKQAAKTNKYRSSKSSVKYSASRLHEKGVLLGIDNLHENQFKNVLFEISSTNDPGIFIVNAKFMGVNMEKVELRFQDLLELQYEGVSVMKMFDKARVNVNLLIYLLNHKFYGKK